jgi:hypothetical protein
LPRDAQLSRQSGRGAGATTQRGEAWLPPTQTLPTVNVSHVRQSPVALCQGTGCVEYALEGGEQEELQNLCLHR